MADNEELMIRQIDGNLFEVFWQSYGSKINLNKSFIKEVFLAVDIKYKNTISDSSMADALLKNVGIFDMVNFICAEHRFHLDITKPELREALEKDDTETTAAWEKAEVIVNGNVVALIVAGAQQADAVDAFNALFA